MTLKTFVILAAAGVIIAEAPACSPPGCTSCPAPHYSQTPAPVFTHGVQLRPTPSATP